jgi:hypothetical protein
LEIDPGTWAVAKSVIGRVSTSADPAARCCATASTSSRSSCGRWT